jgi:MFS family permease
MTTGLGLALGPFVGGVLVHLLNWRWIFWINLPFIALGLILCSFSLRKPDRPQRLHPNWARFTLYILSLGGMMYGIVATAETGGTNLLGLVSLLLGPLILVGLILLDARSQNPIFNHTMWATSELRLSILSCATAGVIAGVFMFFDPLYLHTVKHYSPLLLGIWMGAIPLTQVFASFFFRYLRKKIKTYHLLMSAMVAGLIGMGLQVMFSNDTSSASFLISFVLLGTHWAFANIAGVTLANEKLPPHQTGEAIGTIATVWNVSSAVFLALSSATFHQRKGAFLVKFNSAILLSTLYSLAVTLYALYVWYQVFKSNTIREK